MQVTNIIRKLIILIIAVVVGVLLVVHPGGRPGSTSAVSLAGPPRPPPPWLLPSDPRGGDESESDDDDTSAPVGAYIELQVQPAQVGLWAVVQWQDSVGNWHDVEGWRGSLDADGCKRWWVAAKDFNTGPFQWTVYKGQDSLPLTASAPFTLPYQVNAVKLVEVSLGP